MECTKDAVLIADRNAVQDVKKVVEQIKADGRHEHRVHREVIARGANMTLLMRRPLPGETHHRETGRGFVGTDAPSPRGTLGGGCGNGKSHH
ncbi:hypothetical protein ACLB1S_18915 [Escherichia coli]